MKNNFIKVLETILIIVVIVTVATTIFCRFENPKFTQTEIFLKLWKLYLIVFLYAIFFKLLKKNEK